MREYLRRFNTLAYDVQDNAPSSFIELHKCNVTRLKIWSGASDNTIWGAPEDNYLFRAWHDTLHLKSGLDFSIASEIALSDIQVQLAARIIGDNFAAIVKAEVQGQIEHFDKHGAFPKNQINFTLDYIKAIDKSNA